MKICLPVPDLEEGHRFEPPAKGTLWRVVGYSAKEKIYIIFEAAQQSVQLTGLTPYDMTHFTWRGFWAHVRYYFGKSPRR